ncbi:MAG: hypothetical protein ACK4N5_20960, partial [Myxococcales bacterium]
MRRLLALLAAFSLVACSDDPVDAPDAGAPPKVDAGLDPDRDAGTGRSDAGLKSVGFAALEGPAKRKLLQGSATVVSAVVFLEGVTDAEGAGAGLEVQIGYGPAGSAPSGFQWVPAPYAGDADGLGPRANDRFSASLAPAVGEWDVAAKVLCASCATKELLVDLNWSQPDWDTADAVKLTVTAPALNWCILKGPPTATLQLGRGALQVTGQGFAEGLTEAPGAAAGLAGELGI